MKNVLLILCDQLNASLLGCYGGPVRTPNIDGIASAGVRFNSAYCATPLCSPSRASIVTGVYPHRHGLVHNVMREDYPCVGGPAREEGIDGRDTTTEGLLHGAGYDTAHVGKWHLSGEKPACYPTMFREHQEYGASMMPAFAAHTKDLPREGYMDWYSWLLPVTVNAATADARARIPERWKKLPRLSDFYDKMGRLDMPIEHTYDDQIARRCADFLDGCGDAPFLLTCSFNMPHDPNVVPEPYYSMYRDAAKAYTTDKPCDPLFEGDLSRDIPRAAGDAFLQEFMRIYMGCVAFVDDRVGMVLDALRRRGLDRDTLVIFTADHGDMAGGHGMFWKSTSALYDEVARVPLLISWPDGPQGAYAHPVELVDLMPTILSYAGIAAPEGIDGVDLRPYAAGERDGSGRVALCERLEPLPENVRRPHARDDNYGFMLREGAHKLCLYRRAGATYAMLYDLERDPREYDNRIDDEAYREARDRLMARLRAHLHATGYELDA